MKHRCNVEYLICNVILLVISVCCLLFRQSINRWLLFCWAVFCGLNICRSFSPKCIRAGEEERAARQELFGVFGTLVAWGPVVCIVILFDLLFAVPVAWVRFLAVLGILALIAFAIWYTVIIEKHQKQKSGGVQPPSE